MRRSELQGALDHYTQTVQRAAESRDWTLFGGLFTTDATYQEHAYGNMRGREEITAWAVRTMTSFPGNCMSDFPIGWAVFDEERDWIVCEIRNLMRDPGDGSAYEASNVTILHYAGANLFSYEEDVYNPANFAAMVTAWGKRADRLGTLPEEAVGWLARYAVG